MNKIIVEKLLKLGATNKNNALVFDYKHGNAPHFQREEAHCGVQEGYIVKLWYDATNGIMADCYITTCGAYFLDVMMEREGQIYADDVLRFV